MSTERYDLEAQEATPLNCADTKLLYVSMAKSGGDWNNMMHTHACTEIFYVVGGCGQFKIEEKTHRVNVDDLIVVNPNVSHTEVDLNAAPLEYIVLGVEGLEFSVSDEEGDDRYGIVNFQSGREDILHCLRSMLREIESKPPGYITICQDLLEILLVHLMRRTDFALTPSPPGGRFLKGCVAVRRYIDGHFKENITLDQLAKLAHFNKYYMAHSFSRQYGASPIKYLIARRIKESHRLLATTDHTLSQIAGIVGFSSPSYFSQSFRKLEGMSPMDYRKKHQGEERNMMDR